MNSKKTKDALDGHKERTDKRKKHTLKVIEKTNLLIDLVLTDLENDISEVKYREDLKIFFQKVEDEFSIKADIKIACEQLSKYIIDGNLEGKWDLKIPVTEIKYNEPSSYRNDLWLVESFQLNHWNQKWLTYLDQNDTDTTTYNESQQLASVLISASLNSALSLPEEINALANHLRSKDCTINYLNNYFWMDLIYTSRSRTNNIVQADKEKCYRKWYPDINTLSWINNYLSSKFKSNRSSKELKINSCWEIIQKHLNYINSTSIENITTFEKFCFASIGVTENIPGIDLNYTMTDYCIGKISSSSLKMDYHFLNDMKSKPFLKNKSISFYNSSNFLSAKSNSNHKVAPVLSSKQSVITHTLREFIDESQKQKNSRVNSLKELNQLLNGNWQDPTIILINWLIYKIEVDKIKVSSANTYRSRICSKWLECTNNIDVLNLESSDLEEIYQNILSLSKNDKNLNDTAITLSAFHTFAVQKYGFSSVSTFNDLLKQKYAFVRVGYIPENIFVDLCNSINYISDIDDLSKEALKCIIIITYRTGLRSSEILKLKLNNIKQSLTQWTDIRNNGYGNVKNSSSLRKAPLQIMLTSHELKIVNNYINWKKSSVNYKSDILAFSLTYTPTKLFKKGYVSAIVKSILFELTGLDFVFHDLRHTALSKLHIILENNKTLIQRLTTYSDCEIIKIQHFFNGKIKIVDKDIYWAISGIAGHVTPESTFTHYLHFTDVIIGDKLQKSEQKLTMNTCLNISNVSKRVLTREVNKNGADINSIPLNILKNIISKKLESFSNKIRSYKLSKPKIIEETKIGKLSIDTCWNILNDFEKGLKTQDMIDKYDLPEAEMSNLKISARKITNIVTIKNKSRLFTKKKRKVPITEYLAPRKPSSNVELNELIRAMMFYQKNYLKHKNQIDFCVDYFIHNKTSSSSNLVFAKPKEFKIYIKLLKLFFTDNRFIIKLDIVKSRSKNNQESKWLLPRSKSNKNSDYEIKINEKVDINKDDYPSGKLKLKILHPNKEKRGTNSIAFIFHMFAILNKAEINYSL